MNFSVSAPSPSSAVPSGWVGGKNVAPSTRVLFLLVAAISVLPYLPVLKFGFVYDDDVQILQNPLLQSWHSFGVMFTHQSWSFFYPGARGGYYRPFFLAWLNLNHHLFGLRPAGWHFTSLLLHASVSGLCFLLLRRHGYSPWIAFAAALLFGLHPAHIESVAWISGSTDLLAAAALLASILFWWRRQDAGTRWAWNLFLSLVFYFGALLSKETAIVFPAIVFVYACFHSQGVHATEIRPSQRCLAAFRSAAPYAVVAGAYLVLRRIVLGDFATSVSLSGIHTTAATAPALLLFYIRHIVWPSNLSVFYNIFPNTGFASSAVVFPVFALIALAGVAVWLARRLSTFAVISAFSWFLFPLLPVLWAPFFARGDLVHDRYLYLPCVGAAIISGALLQAVVVHRQSRGRLAFAATLAVLLLMAASTMVQSGPWKDDLALYSHSCSQAPNHSIACNNMAVALISHGEFFRARDVLRSLLPANMGSSRINGNFGIASYRLSDYPAAEVALRRATQLDTSYADGYLYLALTCYRTNRVQEAESLLRRAIDLEPAGDGYHVALGTVLMAESKYREACEEFRTELRLRPELSAAMNLLRDCERQMGPAH